MFNSKLQELMDVIDDNKDNLSNRDYMNICSLLKDLYNNHHDDVNHSNNINDEIRLDYHDIKTIKHFLNIISIITNISCIILMYIYMYNIK